MQKSGKAKKPLSCGECRRLKLKCELVFPCAHCVKRGLASICPDGELVNGSRRVKILASTEDLHKKIAALEEALKAATSSQHPLLDGALYANREEVHTRQSTNKPPSITTAPRPQDHLSSSLSFNQLTLGEDPHVSRYYGAASSVYLSKQEIRSPVGSQSPPPKLSSSHPYSTSPLHFTDLFPPLPCRDAHHDLAEILSRYLPAEDVARALADIYFDTFAWYTQIVQRSDWERYFWPHAYDSITRASPKTQNIAVVFLVLSLGALMDLTKPPQNEIARDLFAAARACLSLDPSHSLTFVRCIYLYGVYLVNGGSDTSQQDAFWPLLRMAMGVVESLGLHRDGSNWNLDEEHATERRTIFWEIHNWDVLQSIGLGRTACIPDYAIDCLVPEGDHETTFHCKAYALTKIWSRINELLVRIRPTTYAEVSEIDQSLADFQRDLPHHLSPAVSPSLLDLTDNARRKEAFQRTMLLLYINEARLTLHRGWFVRILKEYPQEPLSTSHKQSYLACLEACRAIVALVRNMLVLQGQLVQRRWHFFFHLFSACVCLAAAAIRAPCSSLARAVLSELEAGVSLFRMTGRDEYVTLERLRLKAVRAIDAGRLSLENSTETEDLDLLGARTVLRRASVTQPRGTETPAPWAQADVVIFDNFLNANPDAFGAIPPMDDNDQMLNAATLDWSGFDMEAFMQELGAV